MSQSVSPAPAAVTVTPATPQDRDLIAGLMQFYIYDFSEMEPPGSAEMEFEPDGTFAPYPYLDAYWAEADRIPLLIHADGKVAGFALLNTHSHLDGGAVEHNVAEFFVARKHRRRGVAQAALHRILALYPGHWEAAVVARNAGAKVFWPRAIAAAPNVSNLVRVEGDGAHWTGPVFCFDAAPLPALS